MLGIVIHTKNTLLNEKKGDVSVVLINRGLAVFVSQPIPSPTSVTVYIVEVNIVECFSDRSFFRFKATKRFSRFMPNFVPKFILRLFI